MKTLELNQMEQIEGGFDDCTGEVLATLGLAIISIPWGPIATTLAGAYQGHKLYHACFE